MRTFLAALVFTVVVCAQSSLDSAHARLGRQSSLPLSRCTIPGSKEPALCTSYTVPEDRANPRSRRISLNILILPALGGRPLPDPLFPLVGGPGQAATHNAAFFSKTFAALRARRDIVLVDQRGTGASAPLNCNLYAAAPNGFLGDRFPPEGARACLQSLQPRADVRLYTTPHAVADLDDVRNRLGFNSINLFGSSYGTRVALVYLRQHGASVRTMILKGVVNFEPFDRGAVERALGRAIEDCAADPACAGAFPRIAAEAESLRASLKVRSTPPSDTLFLSVLRTLLQGLNTAAQVPLLIHQLASGDMARLTELAATHRSALKDQLSLGMTLSVLCGEDGSYWPDFTVGPDPIAPACRDWPAASLPAGYWEPVRSNKPVLLISGVLDPATPGRSADSAARQLSRARHILIRNASHSYTGLSPCVDQIMSSFIERADATSLDVSCTLSIRRPPFRTRP